MQWLPYDQPTIADRLEIPSVQRTDPSTWTPAELAILFANVEEAYLPWLALAAWAGIRTEELAPDGKSTKDALRWSDVHFGRSVIIIRPEVSKTSHRREEITPRLAPKVAMGGGKSKGGGSGGSW